MSGRTAGLLLWAVASLALPVPGRCESPVSIAITGEPTRPGENRLKNADLSGHEGQERVPEWQFTTAMPGNFDRGWVEAGRSGSGCLHLKAHSDRMSGYWWQDAPVKPGERLMVRCWIRTAGGRNLLYLTGMAKPASGQPYAFDQRAMISSLKSFWLAPEWINPRYLRGPDPEEWLLLQKVVEIPGGMAVLRVHIGAYFLQGELWADDFYVGLPQMEVTVTARSVARGAAGEIRRVEVLGIGGPALLDSGELPAGTRQWQHTLAGLDAGEALLVRVTTADGKKVESGPFPPPAPAG